MADPKPTLLEPPAAAIEAGYWLARARISAKETAEYLAKADAAVDVATPLVMKQAAMLAMQPEYSRRLIAEALAGTHICGQAHDVLRQLMASLGFRAITLDDFKATGLGGGGDR